MNNNSVEDKLIFKVLFFICYTLGFSMMYFEKPVDDGFAYSYGILHSFVTILPIFFIMNNKRIFVYIFCLCLIILGLLVHTTIDKYNIFYWSKNPYLMFLWQIMLILLAMEIYFGFKIMIKEHLNYRKLPLEKKEKLKSAEEIGLRILYFIICLFVYIFSFIVSMIIFDKIYYRNI